MHFINSTDISWKMQAKFSTVIVLNVEQLIVAESRRYSQFSEFYLGFRLGFGSRFACESQCAIFPFFVCINFLG